MKRLTFLLRKVRIWVALRLVRGVDGMVVSRSMFMRAVANLADLEGFPERSGLLKHRTHAAAKLATRTQLVHEALVNAAGVMEPRTTLDEMRNRYVGQRIRSLSRHQQAKPQYQAALAAFNAILAQDKAQAG